MNTSQNKSIFTSYVIGFLLSMILTLTAYLLILWHVHSDHIFIPHEVLIPLIIGLALVQLVVQLIFFLHVLHEEKPRWNLLFLIATVGLIVLVVVASLWIMQHLNYNMTPEAMSNHILQDEGIHH